jgi:hypothetical protein
VLYYQEPIINSLRKVFVSIREQTSNINPNEEILLLMKKYEEMNQGTNEPRP